MILRARKRILSFLEISRTPTMDELVTEIVISDYENGANSNILTEKQDTHASCVVNSCQGKDVGVLF